MSVQPTRSNELEGGDELAALKAALRLLAFERRLPDITHFDTATAAALLELCSDRSQAGAGSLPADQRGHGEAQHSYVILAKVERYGALRLRGGPSIAGALLEALRRRLLECAPGARIWRAGQGVVEFSLGLEAGVSIESALLDLHARLEHPFDCGGEMFTSAVILGAAAAGAGSVGEVVALAEQAMLRAEAQGMKMAVFCQKQRDEASERLSLMHDLRAAVRADELTVAYQPKLNLKTGRIDSAEALLRWNHPTRGHVGPDQFIELAEDTGDIERITESVLEMAVRDQASLTGAGEPPAIYVNLSGRLLTNADFCRRALTICAGAKGKIGVEITETAVIADPERALANLHTFVDAGVGIAIDDYGSGLSSLAYLKMLPADELKIDKAFVLGLTASHRDPLIVRSTIDLAHALEMEVTAEGVDDPTALALLQVMGCDRVQGFHVSRPLALDAFQALLAAPVRADLIRAPGQNLFRITG